MSRSLLRGRARAIAPAYVLFAVAWQAVCAVADKLIEYVALEGGTFLALCEFKGGLDFGVGAFLNVNRVGESFSVLRALPLLECARYHACWSRIKT